MGRRLLTKAPRVDETGAILVNYAADRVGGAQVGRVEDLGATEVCVPLSGGSPLADRKYLIMTMPSEAVSLSKPGTEFTSAYKPGGAGRGATYSQPPDLARYSNRKQFLRGQYFHLPCFAGVQICARAAATEPCASLELS